MITEQQERELVDNDFEVIEDGDAELCIKCPLNRVCKDAFKTNEKLTKDKMKTIRCYYELNGLYDKKRLLFNKWQAFVDLDPKYFMEKMMMNYDVLEEAALSDYSFAKGMQLQYLLMSMHKLKFGEKREVENRTINASVDIKELMDKVRAEKRIEK
jgi:hypothetical protein